MSISLVREFLSGLTAAATGRSSRRSAGKQIRRIEGSLHDVIVGAQTRSQYMHSKRLTGALVAMPPMSGY